MKLLYLTLALLLGIAGPGFGQRSKSKHKTETEKKEDKLNLSGLKFRSIGPALTSGRISDLAINPTNPFEYYVAVSSGGVWKTTNNGTTYSPIFDSQGAYSIGCVTMDPNNHNVIWVGTGENNNQRSVAYGDGIYKSKDGGATWKNMGLKDSEHIGKIIVHPANSDIIWVAAIGPLWNSGGDRGVFKSVDGGENWRSVLTIDEHTGVTDLIIDPRNPDVLYAAAFQRARHVFTYLGGGPGSTIYKSTDGGESWSKSNKGLPSTDLGRIGLAISPADPEIIYAIVEAAQGKSGFYRSTNRGASWEKQSSYVTSGNYYQEIVADPVDPNTVFSMNTYLHASRDGGKTFKRVKETAKHVDSHCMWINPNNNQHWIVGCDGGIYTTFDGSKSWEYKSNLPVTQFYKVSVDNDFPFYYIYGGTQDNFTIGGPSRTITTNGIRNSDWFITHGGDGFETQVDPTNPDIVYSQSQYGVLVRFDRRSGEEVGIQPMARKGENAYRWNWDAPLIASPHAPGRIYFAANKVFRSDDYGNSWDVISDDLTRQINRNDLPIMDRTWSFEAVAKNRSTSPYGTLVAFAESTINPDVLVAGSDDGLIHISENGGEFWRKIDNIPGTPNRSYINALYTSQHDENVIYAVFNHHKYGDFKPYIFKSSDRGYSWKNISGNLPERGNIYAIEEDHISADLLFCGSEFGVYFSNTGGESWTKLKAGVPTISVRDIAIQRRENDLVLGTFGRGFYVLDDYSSLRTIKKETPSQLMPIRDALLFERSNPLGGRNKAYQGDNLYVGDNLSAVALITYFIADDKKTLKEKRRKNEKKLGKEKQSVLYPTYDELRAEVDEIKPHVLFTITNESGDVIRKFTKDVAKGLQRFEWNLRYGSKSPIRLGSDGNNSSTLVSPGEYTVVMQQFHNDAYDTIGSPERFNVLPLNNTVLPATNRADKVAFQREVEELRRSIQGANRVIREIKNKLEHIDAAIKVVEEPTPELALNSRTIAQKINALNRQLNGDSEKRKLDIDQLPAPAFRIGRISWEQRYSTASPTQTHRDSYRIAKEEYEVLAEAIKQIATADMPALEQLLEDAGAPYTPGRGLLMMD